VAKVVVEAKEKVEARAKDAKEREKETEIYIGEDKKWYHYILEKRKEKFAHTRDSFLVALWTVYCPHLKIQFDIIIFIEFVRLAFGGWKFSQKV
jgi:hypothetical protein